MNAQTFVDALQSVYIQNVFNPYRDTCSEWDLVTSARVRRANLELYISEALSIGIDSLWLGRDCGYRGARRTGIALTDEVHLENAERHFGLGGLMKATRGNPLKERTATEVWKVIENTGVKIFLWNVFPFHPHEENKPMGNRRHTSREFSLCKDLLHALVLALKPRCIVALGADAHVEATSLGLRSEKVRHPSYGGQAVFAAQIKNIYSII